MIIVNPFNFETPATRWSFTDREELLPRLSQTMRERGRRILVHGRRRMGKTSLVDQAAAKAGIVWLAVDLSKATDLHEVAQKLLAQLPPTPEKKLTGLMRVLQKYVKVSLAGGRLELRDRTPENDSKSLEQVLDFINEQAEICDSCTTIGFDEFQEIRTLDGPRAEWKLRGIIQRHQHVSYVFSGSRNRLLSWMTEPKAAFYKQLETLHIGPIDSAHLAKWVNERAHRGGLTDFVYGEAIVAAAGPATGDVIRLAKQVFQLVVEKRKGDLVDLAMAQIALGDQNEEYIERWRGLSHPMRVMLRALARGLPPFAAATLKEYGVKTASTASTAVQSLVERELLIREQTGLIFDSPFFRRWVVNNAP